MLNFFFTVPSRVRKLKIDNVTSREVSVSWLPSEEPNVILYGYELIIWVNNLFKNDY